MAINSRNGYRMIRIYNSTTLTATNIKNGSRKSQDNFLKKMIQLKQEKEKGPVCLCNP